MHPSEIIILRELLNSETGHVSGVRLGKLLGVSRVAVWMQLQKLTQHGFVFEPVRRKGYRIVKQPDTLHPALVHAYLNGRPRLPAILCHETVDSTNSEAERRLAAGEKTPFVIFAGQQTQGRGRRGRPWHSAANGNLYATFAFRPLLEPARMQDFTLWMGLNLCELVANFCKVKPGLKWPNDLHIDGKKAGGILTEARIDSDQIRDLVFGLGLNVNGTAARMPRELQRSATSLADASGAPIDLSRLAAALIGRMLPAYDAFLDGSYRETFSALWERYDVLRGRPITVIQGTRTVSGTAAGIDAEGALILQVGGGKTERFRAGEVTLGKDAA